MDNFSLFSNEKSHLYSSSIEYKTTLWGFVCLFTVFVCPIILPAYEVCRGECSARLSVHSLIRTLVNICVKICLKY